MALALAPALALALALTTNLQLQVGGVGVGVVREWMANWVGSANSGWWLLRSLLPKLRIG